jgi:hypothetical protein
MGGQGSGRRYHIGSKNTTDDYNSIDVRRFQREGILTPGYSCTWQWSRNEKVVSTIGIRSEADRIVLSYRNKGRDGEWQDVKYSVFLEYTRCNYGGRRTWFLCPAAGCGRRVAKLYGGKYFFCRHCQDLAYACQREHKADQLARRADKIRVRLGWHPGILNHTGGKPKGMRWRTYERLNWQYQTLALTALHEIGRRIGIKEW